MKRLRMAVRAMRHQVREARSQRRIQYDFAMNTIPPPDAWKMGL